MSKQEDIEFDADVYDAMLYGGYEPKEVEEGTEDEDESDVESEEADTAGDLDETDNDAQEDTDQEDDSEDDEELDEEDDDQPNEDYDSEDEDEEEDSLVEDYDSDEDDDDTEYEEEEAEDEVQTSEDEDDSDTSEDDTETTEQSDGDASDTDEVDYKAFYDAVVNTEFVVNGKKVRGFADPKKIIQSQQMAGGFSEKMAGFKQYRPYMAPLKERGMLEDPAKFDLAMNLIDGDTEAIKQHLKTLNIDPIDLDMDTIAYKPTPATASNESLVIEDVMDRARSAGIEDRVRQVIGKDWDVDSFQEFVSNDRVRDDLLNHIETGAYDKVQDKMAEMSRLDYNGTFGAMNTINKYRAAVRELQREAPVATTVAKKETVAEKVPSAKPKRSVVKAEKAKIVNKRKEEEYKEKASKREAEIAKQRKRAASMSKKKPKAKPKAKFDPIEAQGEDLDNLMDFLIQNGSKIPTA